MLAQQPTTEIIITRDRLSTTDGNAPWDGLKFCLPLGSDALYDKLRVLYPEHNTHEERKRQALLDFLHFERSRRGSVAAATPNSNSASSDSESTVGTDTEGSSSSFSPPPASNLVRPSLPAKRSGQSSTQQASTNLEPQPPGDGSNPYNVIAFDIKDGKEVKVRGRKPMSDEQKANYREKRRKGACPNCRRSKKKCNVSLPHTNMEFVSDMAQCDTATNPLEQVQRQPLPAGRTKR